MNKFMAMGLIILVIVLSFVVSNFIKNPQLSMGDVGAKEATYLGEGLFFLWDEKTVVKMDQQGDFEIGQRFVYEGEGEDIEIMEKTDRKTGEKMDLEIAVEVNAKTDDTVKLIDVREPGEFDSGHVPGAINIPLGSILGSKEFSKDDVLILYCRSGARSATAQKALEREGYYVIDAGGIIYYRGEIER
ncbi:MAG: rhodanese-like domain-containing protein [Peptoniphilus sp.]|nr:rhodanese-like domain-containing protein [Peptoniphilus sp.]